MFVTFPATPPLSLDACTIPSLAGDRFPEEAAGVFRRFGTFRQSDPHCLDGRSHSTRGRLHFAGTNPGMLTIMYVALSLRYVMLRLLPLPGCAFAWIRTVRL